MKIYSCKKSKIPGSDYKEVNSQAFLLYQKIRKKTKRRPYIRSAYFDKSKIFLELFWQHLWGKQNFRDKIRRLRYFPCALELIENSKMKPLSKKNPNKFSETLHRFGGITKDGDLFFVQIKEDTKTNEKWLMSAFPEEK